MSLVELLLIFVFIILMGKIVTALVNSNRGKARLVREPDPNIVPIWETPNVKESG